MKSFPGIRIAQDWYPCQFLPEVIERFLSFLFTIEYTKGKESIADALRRHAIQQLTVSSVISNLQWQQAQTCGRRRVQQHLSIPGAV
mmetsp:Transcript_31286/g.120751  ORF Transcript_31286/g.120751 Transcript_31286/m.120751 type:complete len:87 (-) Transcript_31286:72-332(-)